MADLIYPSVLVLSALVEDIKPLISAVLGTHAKIIIALGPQINTTINRLCSRTVYLKRGTLQVQLGRGLMGAPWESGSPVHVQAGPEHDVGALTLEVCPRKLENDIPGKPSSPK